MLSLIRKGFTLIEVAVVLVVVAILAAIAIPTFATFMDGVDENAARAEMDIAIGNVRALSALDGQMYPLQTGNVGCDTEVDPFAIWAEVIGYGSENPAEVIAGEYGTNGNGPIFGVNLTCADPDGEGPAGPSMTTITLLEFMIQGDRAQYYATVDVNTGNITRFDTTSNPAWDAMP